MVFPSDWLLGTYSIVACIYEWLCGFLSYQSVFVEFHCCHCRWRHFILLLHSLFLIIWPWLFPIWCYSLLIPTRLLYGGLVLLIIVLFTLSHVFFSFSLFDYVILPFLLQILLFLCFYYSFFFSFSTDWRWVSRCFCGQLPSCLLSLIVEYKFILPSWSCRNLMVDLLTNSLFWIAR